MDFLLMTYNIQSGRDLSGRLDIRSAAEVINRCEPDIVGLNEVCEGTREVAGAQQASQLGAATNRNAAFGRAIDTDGGAYGVGLLCRDAMLVSEVTPIPDIAPELRTPHFEHRCVLRCELSLGGRPIAAYVSHFGLAPEEREQAVQTVVRLLKRERLPKLFLGDLNMTPDDPLITRLREEIRDVLDGAPTPYTFPSGEPCERIDYLFASSEFQVLDVFCPSTQASDHRPLLARLRLT